MTAASCQTMKIFLLYGEKDAGKTTTCRKLLKCIMALGGAIVSYDTFKWVKDFKCVTTFANKRIGIYSPGDEKSHLRDAISFGFEQKCDILVATVRKGISYNSALNEMDLENDCVWITLGKEATTNLQDSNENHIVIKLIDEFYNP